VLGLRSLAGTPAPRAPTLGRLRVRDMGAPVGAPMS
jgi:hypothetical protein